MNNQSTNSVMSPSMRAGLDAMICAAAEERAQRDAKTKERSREEKQRRADLAATLRQTVEAFRTR